MKVRVSIFRTLWALIVVSLIAAALLFSISFNLFLFTFPYDWRQYLIIGIWVLSTVGLFLVTFLFSYYEVFKKYVVVHRGNKKLIYYYSDVVYINEALSEKKKTVTFYTRQGHVRYLMFDSKGILYKTMIQNCKERLTKEEFERRYPKVKF
ncbi:MAG: hypothetical protein IJK27_05070 [Bacilli bacterium]|nr:hypothetical protein [Bacilli bacterium]